MNNVTRKILRNACLGFLFFPLVAGLMITYFPLLGDAPLSSVIFAGYTVTLEDISVLNSLISTISGLPQVSLILGVFVGGLTALHYRTEKESPSN